ncbi:MAG: LacI family transcriptional regulator [Ruminococcaceae bacterium]|nr:LacI family transcriptional regulator [Oscillospiraceae bacterium]
MAITIKDVAKASNVSVATVSRVLNKHSNVSDETVEKVTRVMEELGYNPNTLGRDLRKSETKRILAIISDAGQSFYGDVLKGMDEAAFSLGYDILIATTHDNPEHEMHLLKMLMSHSVDGAVLLGVKQESSTMTKLAENYNVALCLERQEGTNALTVSIDNVKAGRDAVNYLIEKGHKRVGLITTKTRSQSSVDREKGYRLALEENNIPFDEKLVFYGNYDPESGTRGCKHLLELEEPPTAIFSISDMIAIGAMNHAISKGIKIGKDLLFFGFDNIAYSHIFVPHLSTVEQPCYMQGKLVIEKLVSNMKSDVPDKGIYLLPHSLVLRESTGD